MSGVIQYKTARGKSVTPPKSIGNDIKKIMDDNTQDKNDVIIIERASTPEECLSSFYQAVQIYNKSKDILFITISEVGMRINGRASRYNLYYFPKTDSIYCECSRTKEFFKLR